MRWLLVWLVALAACASPSTDSPVDAPPIDGRDPLSAPAGLMAMPGDARVHVAWSAVPRAERYDVARTELPNGARTIIASPLSPAFQDQAVTNGVSYVYAVRARNSHEDGPWSNDAHARPAEPVPLAPAGVTAVAGRGKVTLSWQTAADAADHTIERATASGGPYTAIATVTAPPYIDALVTDEVRYFYVLRAGNTGGASPRSAEVSALPTQQIPAVPQQVSLLFGSGEATVSWSPAASASAYIVECGASPSGPFEFCGHVTGLSLTVRSVGSNRWFRVRGWSAAGDGDSSTPIEGTSTTSTLRAPTGLRARPGRDAVTLRWNLRSGATGYQVLRGTASGGPYAPIGTTSRGYFTDSGLAVGSYYYVVRTLAAPSANSNEIAAVLTTSLPPQPIGLAGDAAYYQRAVLRWQPVAGAHRYVVRVTHYDDAEPHVIAEPTAPSFTVCCEHGYTFGRYSVSAVIDGIEGASTPDLEITYGGPYGFSLAAAPGAERIALWITWPVGATARTLYRADSDSAPLVPMPAQSDELVIDDAVTPGVSYRYRASAIVAGEVAWSDEVVAEIDAARVAHPSPPSVAASGHRWVELGWTAVPGAAGYVVHRGEPEGQLTRLGHTTSPSFVDTNVAWPAMRYAVSAYDARGNSTISDPILVTYPAGPPRAPVSVGAEASDGLVAVSFQTSPDAALISRATSAGGPYIDLGFAGSHRYYDTAVTNGVTYYYIVRSSAGGIEIASPIVSATPAPAAAPVVTLTEGDTALEVRWSHVPTAEYYTLYRTTTPGSGYSPYTTGGVEEIVDTGVSAGTTYCYQVAANTLAGEGPRSAEVCGSPSSGHQPPVLLETSSGTTDAQLAWTLSAGATTYRIWRASFGQPLVPLADVAAPPYLDSALTPGAYRYAVTAIGPAGTSLRSSGAVVYVGPGMQPRIGTVSVDASDGRVLVSWDAIGGAAGYDVCVVRTPGTPDRSCRTTFRTRASLTGWSAGQPLTIAVRVHSTVGYPMLFAASDEVTVIPAGGAPAMPTVTLSTGNRENMLEWPAVAGASAYRVWRADALDERLAPVALVTTPYLATGLENGSTVTWAVTALGNGLESGWSAEIDAGAGGRPHPGPDQITVTPHATNATIDAGPTSGDVSWTAATSTSPFGPFTAVTPAGYRGRIVVPASSSTSYVRIAGGGAVRIVAVTASAGPSPPAYLQAIRGNTEVTLAWPAVAGATSYRLYRGPGFGAQGELAPIALVSASPFTDRGLPNGTDVVYAVASIGPGGESAPTPIASAEPSTAAGLAPLMVTASTTAGANTVAWAPSPGGTRYEVCRSTTAGIGHTCTPASSPYIDTAITSGATYHYVVRANGGAWSTEIAATAR